jgi:membrane-bound serine protease (ClpP class)
VLANPNVAYILMILGFYGLLYEITNPGIGVPGIMGVMFLILALYSMQTLPTNYAGLALIVLALLLFGAEAMAPGIGLLAFGGATALVLGSLILFNSDNPAYRVSLPLILGCAGTTMGITLLLVRSAFNAKRAPVTTGAEGMAGLIGVARTSFEPGVLGQVFAHGELWQAYSDVPVKEGDRVEVVRSYNLKLKVKPADQGAM